MPKYDIICSGSHRHEVTKHINAPLPPCPTCGDTNVVQELTHPPMVVLRSGGVGWASEGYSKPTKA